MREGLWRTKKRGSNTNPKTSQTIKRNPNKLKEIPNNQKESQQIQKCQKMEYGRWARRCATVRKQFFPGDNGRNGAQIGKMPFWGLRNSLSAGKYMYHEENLRPDSILKSRSRLLFKNDPFLANIVSIFYCKKITIQNRCPHIRE